MNITDTVDYIRQQQPGQFRGPEYGKGPFAHVNDQKLNSMQEQEQRSAYVKNEKVVTWQKETIEPDFPKLFDHNAGLKVDTKKTSKIQEEKEPQLQYDKTGKAQIETNQKTLVDQWA